MMLVETKNLIGKRVGVGTSFTASERNSLRSDAVKLVPTSSILLPLGPHTLETTAGKAECGGYGEQCPTQNSQCQGRRNA